VVHLVVDTCDAMGANLINTVAEGVAPFIEELTGGKVYLASSRTSPSDASGAPAAGSRCPRSPPSACRARDRGGGAAGLALRERRPVPGATHNKGIMNGIDAVAVATGQDWALARGGGARLRLSARPLRAASTWSLGDGFLTGRIELPLALGTVGVRAAFTPACGWREAPPRGIRARGSRWFASVGSRRTRRNPGARSVASEGTHGAPRSLAPAQRRPGRTIELP